MLVSTMLGENVVSKASAETLGSVEGVVMDAAGRKITALQLGKGRKARVVPWPAITGVGSAAVVVDHDDAVRSPTDDEQRYVGGDVAVIGGLVLSDRGNAHGRVVDIDCDASTGNVLSIRTESTTIEAKRLHSIGTYAWIIAADIDEPS